MRWINRTPSVQESDADFAVDAVGAAFQVVHRQVQLVHDGQQADQQAAVGLSLDGESFLIVPAAGVGQVGVAALDGVGLAGDLLVGLGQRHTKHCCLLFRRQGRPARPSFLLAEVDPAA